VALALLIFPVISRGELAIFQGVGSASTFLQSDNPNNPQLTSAILEVGGQVYRSLIRFDLSSLAGQYSLITEIQLNLIPLASSPSSNTLLLHEVSSANGDWAARSASWNYKNQDTTTAWSGGEGLGTSGYGATLANVPWTSGDLPNPIIFTIADPSTATALVNDFTDGMNEGFIITSTKDVDGGGGLLFLDGTEYPSASLQPTLAVTYTVVPEPSATLMLIGSLAVFGQRKLRRQPPGQRLET